MKKLFFLSLLFPFCMHAQLEWRALPTAITNIDNQRFDDIFFINDNVGWAANGAYAAVYKTTDAGVTWTTQVTEQSLGGDYYFRNIDNRILFGGGRNLDFETEETTVFGETELVQNRLEELLKTVILPNVGFEVDQRWSGIMGMGNKRPLVKQLSDRVFCGVRLGGMGIAIGSIVGKELADLV